MNKARAFTLMEILIVVVLLGVLAAVVIPTVAHSTTSAKDSALAADLQFNEKDTVEMLADGQAFPANADDSYGWIYKAATS